MKGETIPRMELMSAFILARLITTVSNALEDVVSIDNIYCWQDSQITLWWIYGTTKEFGQFVQNRLVEIRKLVNFRKWKYCPSDDNPSDIPSRGMKLSKLMKNSKWWKGPKFLSELKQFWPNQLNFEKLEDSLLETNLELKGNPRFDYSNVFVNAAQVSSIAVRNIITCEACSNVDRLLRVTSFVLRFVNNLKNKLNKTELIVGNLQSEEISCSLNLWCKQAQITLHEESDFKRNKIQLQLFQDEKGLLRCTGRVQNAPIAYATKHPILMPRNHHLTKLLVYRAHGNVKHGGTRETLTDLRSTYWVVRGRQLVKQLLSKCVICKRLHGKPYSSVPAPPLPNFRVAEAHAFSVVGANHAGHVFVRNIFAGDSTMFKSYILVITCTSSRSIHLEITPDLSGPAFIRSFIRFQGRRGSPSLVVSDNASAFKDQRLKRYLQSKNINWQHNIPRASWWGGFYEVMVKLTKKCLKKIAGNAKLLYEEMETLLIEIEGVLNSRPLTYCYDELDEPPLTPSSLVIGRRLLDPVQLDADIDAVSSSRSDLVKRDRYLRTLLSHFENCFKHEYLTSLREFHHNKLAKNECEVSIGDIVYLQDNSLRRQQWNMAKIEELLPGKDGIVRAAVIRTLDKSKRPILLKRALKHLYPLEVTSDVRELNGVDLKHKEESTKDIDIRHVPDEDVRELIV